MNLFLVIVVCSLIIWFYSKIEKEKREHEELLELVNDHLKELLLHRKLGTKYGDFKIVDDSQWKDKKHLFIRKIILKDQKLSKKDLQYNYEYYGPLIDDLTKDFEAIENTVEISNGFQYEIEIGKRLTNLGWETKVTKGSGDHGVDIVVSKNNKVIAIQCKFYSNPVSNKAVQEVSSGKIIYNADLAAVVTNSSYTKHAQDAANRLNVILLHDSNLEQLDKLL